jgi:hypothetical protein
VTAQHSNRNKERQNSKPKPPPGRHDPHASPNADIQNDRTALQSFGSLRRRDRVPKNAGGGPTANHPRTRPSRPRTRRLSSASERCHGYSHAWVCGFSRPSVAAPTTAGWSSKNTSTPSVEQSQCGSHKSSLISPVQTTLTAPSAPTASHVPRPRRLESPTRGRAFAVRGRAFCRLANPSRDPQRRAAIGLDRHGSKPPDTLGRRTHPFPARRRAENSQDKVSSINRDMSPISRATVNHQPQRSVKITRDRPLTGGPSGPRWGSNPHPAD